MPNIFMIVQTVIELFYLDRCLKICHTCALRVTSKYLRYKISVFLYSIRVGLLIRGYYMTEMCLLVILALDSHIGTRALARMPVWLSSTNMTKRHTSDIS